MTCDKIIKYKCVITNTVNPTDEYCLLACPLKHGHKPEESLDVYLEKKHGIKIGQTKPVETSNSKTILTSSANMLQIFNGWCQLCSAKYKECDSYDYTRNRRQWCFCGKSDKEILEICPEGKFENLIRIVNRFEVK